MEAEIEVNKENVKQEKVKEEKVKEEKVKKEKVKEVMEKEYEPGTEKGEGCTVLKQGRSG